MKSFCGKYSHNRLRRVYRYIYIYISPKRRWSSLAGIKMESLKGGGLFPWFPTTIDDERFSCEMGGREGLLLADGFICLLFFALRGSRSIRSNRWKFAEGQRCFSPFPSSFSSFSSFFFFLGGRIGHDNDRFIGSRTHKRRVSTRSE